MKMVNFTFNMLKKEKKNSIGYTISLSFVIAIIYVFFNVFVNPYISKWVENYGSFSLNMMIASLTVLSMLIFLIILMMNINNYYLMSKKRELALLILFGGTRKKITLFYTIQNIMLFCISMILGIIIGSLLLPIVQSFVYFYLSINSSIFFFSIGALKQTIQISICLMITIFVVNYIYIFQYKEEIIYLLKTQVIKSFNDERWIKLDKFVYLFLYILGLIMIYTGEHLVFGYIIFSLIGSFGVYGLIKYSIPELLKNYTKKIVFTNSILSIASSLIREQFMQSAFISNMIVVSSTILLSFSLAMYNEPGEYIKIILEFFIINIILNLVSYFRYNIESKKRKSMYKTLGSLGYKKKDIYSVMKYEVVGYYGCIVFLGIIYIISILLEYILHYDFPINDSIIICILFLLPNVISCYMVLKKQEKLIKN